MRKYIFFSIMIMLSIVSRINAKDLSEYFSVDDVKICSDDNCDIICDDEIGCKATSKFLVQFKGSLHSPSVIEDGDTAILPFANEKFSEETSAYDYIGFSWSDIFDNNNNKIGVWKVDGSGAARKITIKFSDTAIGKTDVTGEFITTRNITARYNFSDKIIPLTIGQKKKYIKFNTYPLTETRENSTFLNNSSSNDMITLQAVAPRITIKQLYDTDHYSSFTADAVLNNLYFELPIPMSINANMNKLSFIALSYLPVSLTNTKASIGANNFDITSFFSEVSQNENETYQEFKNRLNERQYGIYNDGENKVLVVNYGSQPSTSLSYADVINNIDSSLYEPGEYGNSINPYTINSSVRDIINNKLGSLNRINGKIASYGLSIQLQFPTVKIETIKSFNGKWSWINEKGEVKEESKTVDAKMIVPSSIANVNGASQLILVDKDTKNEIIGANIKLQKKIGNAFEDVEELTTDITGMVMFRNLESGIYRFVQTSYLPHYRTDSFTMYNNEDIGADNIIADFELNADTGNVIYATNEREKYTVTYKKGTHGNFDDQFYENIPYGEPTPYYEPVGENNWIFKGWNPEQELFVTDNATYTATWSKLVDVTAKYLEVGTNTPLLDDIVDTKENGKEYETIQKDIENYEFVRVDGNPSGTRGEEDIVVTYYYKKKESNLNIKYLDCTTSREIANSTNEIVYYGDNYDADSYESNISIPENYIRSSAFKSDNYKGVVESDNINVEYCYNKKDSNLNASITMTGTNKITKSTDKVSYQINYSTVFTDYIGEATIKIVDTLPYKIDINNSNLDGGVYDEDNKTITWQVNTNINSYENSEYNITKNIELKYKNINLLEDVMVNNVTGKTEIESKNEEVSTLYNTYIDVKGTIVVKYLENVSNEELEDSVTTIDKVGKEYEFVKKDIEGYRLVKKPEKEKEEYKEEEQEFKYLYERIKYKVTVTSNEGGSVTGDEEVYYNEDSTLDNIKIKANDNYYIKEIKINERIINIPEKSKELTIPQFKKMLEDKKIEVVFEKEGETVVVPNTLKKSMLIIFGVVTVLGSVSIMLYILYKKNKISLNH